MRKQPKVVLDTNIVISAFLTPEKSRTIVELTSIRKILSYSSPSLEAELRKVLKNKLNYTQEELTQAMLTYREITHQFVFPEKKLHIIKTDETDNRILEAAQESQADFIISGDMHLLKLDKFKSTQIINPSNILNHLKQ